MYAYLMQWVHAMDLKRLRHVLALAQEMNFIRAAEKVHLSQPAFSRSIQALEGELGMPLFDRSKQGLTLTAVGKEFVARAKRLVHEAKNLERDMALTRLGELGPVHFGVGPLPAASLAPQLLRRVRQGRPQFCANLQVNNARYLLTSLLNEEIEFFIAETRDIPTGGEITVTPLMRQYGPFACRPEHPLLAIERPMLHDLRPYSFASLKLPKAAAALLSRALDLAPDAHLPIILECDDIGVLTRIVRHEDLILIASHDAVADEIQAGALCKLHIVDMPPLFVEIGIVQLRGRTLSPSAGVVIATLYDIAAEEATQG